MGIGEFKIESDWLSAVIQPVLPGYTFMRAFASPLTGCVGTIWLNPEKPVTSATPPPCITMGEDTGLFTPTCDVVHVNLPYQWLRSILVVQGWGDLRVFGGDVVGSDDPCVYLYAAGGNIPEEGGRLPMEYAEYVELKKRDEAYSAKQWNALYGQSAKQNMLGGPSAGSGLISSQSLAAHLQLHPSQFDALKKSVADSNFLKRLPGWIKKSP
jgi:hypothetical protein